MYCELQKIPEYQIWRKTRSSVLCCVVKLSLAASGTQDVRGEGGVEADSCYNTSDISLQALCNTVNYTEVECSTLK